MFVIFSDSISNAIKLYTLELKWILQTKESKAQRGLMNWEMARLGPHVLCPWFHWTPLFYAPAHKQ